MIEDKILLSVEISKRKVLNKKTLKKIKEKHSVSSSKIFSFISFSDKFLRKYKNE